MKRISVLLLALVALSVMTIPVFADVIPASPAEVMISAWGSIHPLVLIVAVLIVTALLIRHFTRKK